MAAKSNVSAQPDFGENSRNENASPETKYSVSKRTMDTIANLIQESEELDVPLSEENVPKVLFMSGKVMECVNNLVKGQGKLEEDLKNVLAEVGAINVAIATLPTRKESDERLDAINATTAALPTRKESDERLDKLVAEVGAINVTIATLPTRKEFEERLDAINATIATLPTRKDLETLETSMVSRMNAANEKQTKWLVGALFGATALIGLIVSIG